MRVKHELGGGWSNIEAKFQKCSPRQVQLVKMG